MLQHLASTKQAWYLSFVYSVLTGKYCDKSRREMKMQMRHRAGEKKISYWSIKQL